MTVPPAILAAIQIPGASKFMAAVTDAGIEFKISPLDALTLFGLFANKAVTDLQDSGQAKDIDEAVALVLDAFMGSMGLTPIKLNEDQARDIQQNQSAGQTKQ